MIFVSILDHFLKAVVVKFESFAFYLSIFFAFCFVKGSYLSVKDMKCFSHVKKNLDLENELIKAILYVT